MFSVPKDSPLSVGWRARLVATIARQGLAAVQDVISAYAELRFRAEDSTFETAVDRATDFLAQRERVRAARERALARAALRRIHVKRYATV
jgi:hypothetical protein